MGHFFYAAKAFDILERMDMGESDILEAKMGACVGTFQMVAANKESEDNLQQVCDILKSTNNP